MASRTPAAQADLIPRSDPGVSPWTYAELQRVVDRYPDWFNAFPADEPVYALPPEALAVPRLRALLGDSVPAEREFARVCQEQGILGVWGSSDVNFWLLTRRPLRVDPAYAREAGWDDRLLAEVADAETRAQATAARLLGMAGWLMTDPTFLNELAAVRHLYLCLPATARPSFPLSRGSLNLLLPDGNSAEFPRAVEQFAEDLHGFFDRWGIGWLDTWDLPFPQGPLLPNTAPSFGAARRAQGVNIFVPRLYPLDGEADLHRLVRRGQESRSRALGLPVGSGPGRCHEQYAQMFRLAYLELAVRGRFPGRRPRGLVSAVEAAAAEYLGGVTVEHVHRLRLSIAACRRGPRAATERRDRHR